MKIEKVNVYKTSDGMLHNDKYSALVHEARSLCYDRLMKFIDEISDLKSKDGTFKKIDTIIKHKDVLCEFIGYLDSGE